MKLTATVIHNQALFFIQSEVEAIALTNVGTAEDIYFNKIPITSQFYIEFDQAFSAWRLYSYPTTNKEKKELKDDQEKST